ncbi:hypothetical protein FHX15_005947 [Rhizobium sp. BK650]|nr:hypothetical protein [Rhizobium sp. BK650]
MREPIGVIGICFVGGHVERRLGMTGIDADGGSPSARGA